MCSGVNRVSIFAWTESPPQRGPSPYFRVDQVRFSVRIGGLQQSPKNGDVFWSGPSPNFCVDRVRFLVRIGGLEQSPKNGDVFRMHPPPLKAPWRGRGGFGFNYFFYFYNSRNVYKIVSVLLSASVKRVGVSCTRDFVMEV